MKRWMNPVTEKKIYALLAELGVTREMMREIMK